MVKLTEAEWAVLQVLWEGESCSLGEVVSALEPTRHWRRNTVHIDNGTAAENMQHDI